MNIIDAAKIVKERENISIGFMRLGSIWSFSSLENYFDFMAGFYQSSDNLNQRIKQEDFSEDILADDWYISEQFLGER